MIPTRPSNTPPKDIPTPRPIFVPEERPVEDDTEAELLTRLVSAGGAVDVSDVVRDGLVPVCNREVNDALVETVVLRGRASYLAVA
jgi:hypothetical protein